MSHSPVPLTLIFRHVVPHPALQSNAAPVFLERECYFASLGEYAFASSKPFRSMFETMKVL